MADRERLQRKLMEEAFEVCLELHRPDVHPDRMAEEAADLMFHLMAALVAVGMSHDEVLAVLARRHAP